MNFNPKTARLRGYMLSIVMDVFENASISQDFKEKPLIPIVWSHGRGGSRDIYSGLCSELASQGYIVFALNHQDQSCGYTTTSEGQDMFYDNRFKPLDLTIRIAQLSIRDRELRALVKEIYEDHEILVKNKLYFSDVKIATDKIIVGGHSFGGITSLSASEGNP
jgi:platelet-activating factor acetylhydrolase